MKRILIMILAVTSLSAAKKAPLDWKTGKVVTLDYARDVQTSSVNPDSGRVGHVYIKSNTFVVEGDEFAYTLEDVKAETDSARVHSLIGVALANRKHGCRFIVNDDIKYAQEQKDKDHLWVIDSDGKQCKLEIVRQERIKTQ